MTVSRVKMSYEPLWRPAPSTSLMPDERIPHCMSEYEMKRSTLWTVLVLHIPAGSTLSQVFYPVGDLPGGEVRSFAFDVTDSGVAIGYSLATNNEWEAYIWTPSSGMTGLGILPGTVFSQANAISADGRVVVGLSGEHAFRWTASGGMQLLSALPNGLDDAVARAVSHDGSVIVGDQDVPADLGGYEAFRWTESTGAVGLGVLNEIWHRSRATVISGDGAVVAGYDTGSGQAFRWTEDSGLVPLGGVGIDLPRPTGISFDGSVIVGNGAGPEAFRWTEESGYVSLGSYTANDVSDDGSVIVGNEFYDSRYWATIWTESAGWRRLDDILADDFGVALPGWQLNSIESISPNGQVIAGRALNPQGAFTGFVLFIPSPGAGLLLPSMCLVYSRRRRSS